VSSPVGAAYLTSARTLNTAQIDLAHAENRALGQESSARGEDQGARSFG